MLITMQVGLSRSARTTITGAKVAARVQQIAVTVVSNRHHYNVKRNRFSTKTRHSWKDPIRDSGNTVYALESHPELVRVPSLPYLGSLLPFYSKTPPMDMNKLREWTLEMSKICGHFYTYGVPGYGEGSHGTTYYISDPREYMKVIRHEGTYPSGLIQNLWPIIRFFKDNDKALTRGDDNGFFGRGHDWKIIRNFVQTDLLSPQAAAGYVPGVILAAELASKGAPASSDNLNEYLNRCAFDMFCSVMFGDLLQVADPKTLTDPENLEFVESAAAFIALDAHLIMDPVQVILANFMRMKTDKYKEFEDAATKVYIIASKKIKQFQKKYKAGSLTEFEQKSFLASAVKRQAEQKGSLDSQDYISEEMMIGACVLLLAAAVDTTSGILSWALLHAALNPEIQEKLFLEIRTNLMSEESGHIIADVFNKRSNLPYLHAFLRESHRVTPAIISGTIKQVSSEVEIHGIKIPAKSKLIFNNYPIPMDPAYVERPHEFLPERWLPDAVDARRGTPQELIDHPFFKDPFSFGARKCPGSRVAFNEAMVFLCQLILDYRIRAPAEFKSYIDVPYKQLGTLTPEFPKLEFIPRNI